MSVGVKPKIKSALRRRSPSMRITYSVEKLRTSLNQLTHLSTLAGVRLQFRDWRSKRLEVGEARLEDLVRKPPRGQSPGDMHRTPSEVEIEIAQRCRHRWQSLIVEDD